MWARVGGVMPKYEFDAVRWCESMKNAHFSIRNWQMAENFKLTRLRIEGLEAELAALRDAVRPVMDGVRLAKLRRRDDVLYPVSIFDALGALVGEE